MKPAEFNKIMKGINFPERFIINGRLAYCMLNHDTGAKVLVGFLLGNSSDIESFMFHYFVQCLYEPFTTYNLSLGDRIGLYWTINDIDRLNVNLKNFRKFDSLNTFDDFIPYLENNTFYGNELGRTQYFALTYFIEKNFEKALQYLAEIIKLKSHSNPEWFKEDILNAEFIKSCIEKDNYQKGIEQILKWQSDTMKSLKLKE